MNSAAHKTPVGRPADDSSSTALGGGSGRSLSDREREVLSLLATGLTNEALAVHLGLSHETTRTHLRNAMRKLGAKTRVHAVALALALDEIELPSAGARHGRE